MAFQDSAMSIRSRLHLGDVKPSVLMGILAISAVVLTCACFGLNAAMDGGPALQVEHAQGASDALADQPETGEAAVPKEEVCVYVSGEVEEPGVYRLAEGSRVGDAIDCAGGFRENAAVDSLNLARVLVDGEHINVVNADTAEGVEASAGASPSNGLVNINSASIEGLQQLDGVGESTARKIVAEREAHGPFKTIDDLKRVPGIGDKKLEGLRDQVCL